MPVRAARPGCGPARPRPRRPSRASGGVVAGVALALAIDWIQLSWQDASASTERSILAPQVTVGEQGLSLGVLGRF